MSYRGSSNHPFVVWASCFLWLTSLFAITWSLVLFFSIGDVLLLIGTDLVNALVLLSGLIMLPTNVHMLYSISNGMTINYRAKVACCPLWLCIIWIIVINTVGVVLCIQRILLCHETTVKIISQSMKHYRYVPKYKHFIDNLQWSLKCCGGDSYRDWFTHDWYDKTRDYEWVPKINEQNRQPSKEMSITDSVPLSCCKSGSCISNYLLELGTRSIHTNGCGDSMYRLTIISMYGHLALFLSIIIVEIFVLKCIVCNNQPTANKHSRKNRNVDVRHLMAVKENFDAYSLSSSYQLNPEHPDDSDDLEQLRQSQHVEGNEIRQPVGAVDL